MIRRGISLMMIILYTRLLFRIRQGEVGDYKNNNQTNDNDILLLI